MAFINRYTKGDSLNYYYSEEFIQKGKSIIFAIGKEKAEGLITCTNTEGQLIWERVYNINNERDPISFQKVVQIQPYKEFDFQYIIHAVAGTKHYLISIDSEKGDINWIKQLPLEYRDVILHLEASPNDFTFYVVFSSNDKLNGPNHPFVAKFFGDGSFSTGSHVAISKEEFYVEAVDAFKEGLVLVGRYIEKDSRGVVIELTNDLKLNKHLQIIDPYTTIHDVKWIDGKYLVSGYLIGEGKVFVSLLNNIKGQLLFSVENTKDNHSQIQVGKDGVYLLTYHNTHGVLHFLDTDFNTIWSKELRIQGLDNGISQFSYKIETGNIVTTGYNQKVKSVLVFSGDQFNTCHTKILQEYITKGISSSIKGLNILMEEGSLKPVLHSGSFYDLTSSIIEYCPVVTPDLKNSTITATPDCILPSGGQSTVTVQLVDTNGVNITNGSNTVVITTSYGNISATTNNNDGTYTAILTSAFPGNATLSFTINGQNAGATANVTISKDCNGSGNQADLKNSTITAIPDCILPSGGQSTVTVQLVDSDGANITNGTNTVVIATSYGNISATTNNNDGTYTAILTSAFPGNATLSFTINGQNAGATANVTISKDCDGSGNQVDLENSTIVATSNCIQPTSGAAIITVQLVDTNGNLITNGNNTVIISTSLGDITATTNNANGTYTATLTSNTAGTATLSFTVDGNSAAQTVNVTVSQDCNDPGNQVDLENSTIVATSNCIQPTSGASIITVQLIDVNGNLITNGNNTVIISTSLGNITATTNNNNGTYTATLTSNTAGTATLSFTVDGNSATQTVNVTISQDCDNTVGTVDLNASTIVATPNQIEANGTSTSTITVTLLDTNGNPVTTTLPVTIVFVNGMSFQATLSATNPGSGVYTATLQSANNQVEQVELSFTVGTQEAFGNVALVDIVKQFNIRPSGHLQSPNLYMQAAGSTGNDGSVSGIHLRWMLKGFLGNTHLPKGNHATTTNHFNKPDDFVRIYKAAYTPLYTILDFQEQSPIIVDNNHYLWIYTLNGYSLYVYFKNTVKYDQVRTSIDPVDFSYNFLQAYGDELIEVDHKTTLSFAVTLKGVSGSTNIDAEVLSVENNNLTAVKYLTARQEFTGEGRFEEENIRVVRYKANHVKQIYFERYANVLSNITDENNWSFVGAYALTTNNSVAENRLEAVDGSTPINGQWPRFNDNETVNKDNYIDRWNGEEEQLYGTAYYESYDRRLKTTIQRYIEITDAQPTNPTAIEAIPFSTTLPEGVDSQDQDIQNVPNLKILQIGSMDYHLARMMGLGHIDVNINTSQPEEKYIYLAEYITVDNISNGQQDDNAAEIQHLYMSLPTAMVDERLPIPVNLLEPVLGTNNPEGNSLTGLIDDEGYLFDGKQRFISLVSENLPENQTNTSFYESSEQFSTAEATTPVYLGVEYKLFDVANPNASSWRKPELSNTADYHNYMVSGEPSYVNNETVPLLIPEPGETLFLHREREEGWHRYSSYGINWFSRSQMSTVFWDLETKFKPQNRLLPPSNIKACLVVEENPLMMTSANEQVMYETNTNTDKTLIRLTFDHHIDQDRLTYQINQESMGSFTDPLDANAIFKDDREVFADNINIFFRNRIPKALAGKIKSIVSHANNALAVIRTESYVLASTGQTIAPEIASDQLSHFIGSVFMFNDIKYIVYQVAQSTILGEGPIFTVYKQVISEAMMNGSDPDPSMPLTLPEFTNPGQAGYNPNTIVVFNTVENMLTETNWQVGTSSTVNKLDFQVQIGANWDVHREVIDEESISGVPEQIVEKSRGIWETALIEEELRPQAVSPVQYDTDGNIMTELVHTGMYKITFPNILEHHPQFLTHNIDWYQGIVRIHTQNNPTKKRKILEVVRIENIGAGIPFVVYAIDPQYPVNVPDVNAVEGFDPILTGNQEVNFYPGYRIYLYHDAAHHLTEEAILPDTGEGLRYSIFGLQTIDPDHPEDETDPNEWYTSKISQPSLFFAQEIIRPETPLMSNGEEFIYATRPDTFGKSTFTLTPGFSHIPHGVQFYRTNDDAILNALYKPSTVLAIKTKLKEDLDAKLHLVKRWQNLLEFNLEYDATFQTDGQLFLYPEDETGYRFPMPDKYQIYKAINDILEYRNQNYGATHSLLDLGDPDDDSNNGVIGTLAFTDIVIPALPSENINDDVTFMEYMKSVIYNAFTPLTEIPLMYQHINDSDYQPIAKKQVIRDDNGTLLAPDDPKFDMAPMAKKMSSEAVQNIPGAETAVLFTDFNIEGTSDNLYFYAIREMGNTMQLGDYSTILGPIKLVNTKPPQAPEVRRILPVLQNDNLGIVPGVSVEINAYPKIQNIKQLKLYRTLDPAKALSVRTMDLVKTIDVEVDGQIDNNIWKIKDEFNDLGYVPYSDPLYYKLTVLREITYADGSNVVDAMHPEITEYAPSEPSKLLISSIVENSNPQSPVLQYNFDADTSDTSVIHNVILKWYKKVHNGKYHVHKMNSQGNWVKILTLDSNLEEIQLLLADTTLENGTLSIENEEGNPRYHHFKVISENSVGMLSTEENVMTIPNENNIAPDEGIGDMIIENTNIVR